MGRRRAPCLPPPGVCGGGSGGEERGVKLRREVGVWGRVLQPRGGREAEAESVGLVDALGVPVRASRAALCSWSCWVTWATVWWARPSLTDCTTETARGMAAGSREARTAAQG